MIKEQIRLRAQDVVVQRGLGDDGIVALEPRIVRLFDETRIMPALECALVIYDGKELFFDILRIVWNFLETHLIRIVVGILVKLDLFVELVAIRRYKRHHVNLLVESNHCLDFVSRASPSVLESF